MDSIMDKKYAWSRNIGDEIWRGGPCDSIDECVKEAIAEGYEDGDKIAVGITELYKVTCVNSDQIIECLQIDAEEAVGGVAEDWLCRLKKEQREDLEQRLLKVVLDWLKDCNEEPTFYKVFPSSELITIRREQQCHK